MYKEQYLQELGVHNCNFGTKINQNGVRQRLHGLALHCIFRNAYYVWMVGFGEKGKERNGKYDMICKVMCLFCESECFTFSFDWIIVHRSLPAEKIVNRMSCR